MGRDKLSIKVIACCIDSDDGEGAITEVYSGKVLKRGFGSAQGAGRHLQANQEKYEAMAMDLLTAYETDK